jgi:hypothetical protein
MIRRPAAATSNTFRNWITSRYRNRLQPIEAIANYGAPLPRHPNIKKIMHITKNRKNKNLAIPADAAAIPPNPNTAATIAIIRKVMAQPNIVSPPLAVNRMSELSRVCFIWPLA